MHNAIQQKSNQTNKTVPLNNVTNVYVTILKKMLQLIGLTIHTIKASNPFWIDWLAYVKVDGMKYRLTQQQSR